MSLFIFFLIALPAQGFIFLLLTKHYPLVAFYLAMTHVCQCSTLHAYCVHLLHIVGNGTQSRHRTERHSSVVHVKSCHNHSQTAIG